MVRLRCRWRLKGGLDHTAKHNESTQMCEDLSVCRRRCSLLIVECPTGRVTAWTDLDTWRLKTQQVFYHSDAAGWSKIHTLQGFVFLPRQSGHSFELLPSHSPGDF